MHRFPLGFVSLAIFMPCLLPFAQGADAAFSTDPGMKALRKSVADRTRRIIYNNDGGEPMGMERFSLEDFLALRTKRLVGTQVDTIFYCTYSSGFGQFTHNTKVGQIFTNVEDRHAKNKTKDFIDAGTDPLATIVDYGHKNGLEIFWSLRMNDTHDGATGKSYGPILFRSNRLKNDHPDWLLGSEQSPPFHGKWTGVNYEIPGIRDMAFRLVEEVCRNYDIDGVELDFFRHPTFFRFPAPGQPATDAQRQLMTDLMRRIRLMMDAEGKKRGRPILLAMRVPDSVEYCRAIGLDLELWLQEDLLDLLIPTGYFRLNDWAYSATLGHQYGVKVYASLDEPRIDDKEAQKARMSANAYRGRAAEAWAAGVDGIYLYNFFKKDSPFEILHQLGDPVTLAKMNKDHFASLLGRGSVAGGGFPHGAFQHIETLTPENPKKISPGKSVEVSVNLPENLSGLPSLRLRLRFGEPVSGDAVQVQFNGRELSHREVKQEWLEMDVPIEAAKRGTNAVQVSLASREKTPLVWNDLQLQVAIDKNP